MRDPRAAPGGARCRAGRARARGSRVTAWDLTGTTPASTRRRIRRPVVLADSHLTSPVAIQRWTTSSHVYRQPTAAITDPATRISSASGLGGGLPQRRVLGQHGSPEFGLELAHPGQQLPGRRRRGCAPRAGRRCGRRRSRRWPPGCRPASARWTAASPCRRGASAAPARRSPAAGSPRRPCRAGAPRRPAPGDDDPQPAVGGGRAVVEHRLRGPVRRDHADLVRRRRTRRAPRRRPSSPASPSRCP